MVIHHASEENVSKLEELFAVLTPQGWVIPAWVQLLRATIIPKKD